MDIDAQIAAVNEELRQSDTSGSNPDDAGKLIDALIAAYGRLSLIAEEQERRIVSLEHSRSLSGPGKNILQISDAHWVNLDNVADFAFDGERKHYAFYLNYEERGKQCCVRADERYTQSITDQLAERGISGPSRGIEPTAQPVQDQRQHQQPKPRGMELTR